MITYDQLHAQSHEITELSNVLRYLLNDRSMCDTGTCCELFYRFGEKMQAHLDTVEHTYGALLNSHDDHARKIAQKFMGGTQEIKRIFNQYTKTWCARHKQQLHIADHAEFLKDTRQMFDIILNRIQDETEQLYPLIRAIKGDSQRAA